MILSIFPLLLAAFIASANSSVRLLQQPTCCDLPRIANGEFDQTEKSFAVSSVRNFACRKGYHVRGSPVVTCKRSGAWEIFGFCEPTFFSTNIGSPRMNIKKSGKQSDNSVKSNDKDRNSETTAMTTTKTATGSNSTHHDVCGKLPKVVNGVFQKLEKDDAHVIECKRGYSVCDGIPPNVRCNEKTRKWSPVNLCVKDGVHSSYFVVQGKVGTWYDAEKLCGTKGGRLAHIRTAPQQALAFDTIRRIKKRRSCKTGIGYWIGGRARNPVKPFKWADESRIGFKFWARHEPNRSGCYHKKTFDTCVLMYPNGRWADSPCSERTVLGAICETLSCPRATMDYILKPR